MMLSEKGKRWFILPILSYTHEGFITGVGTMSNTHGLQLSDDRISMCI
jgi:hypothetical protein